MVILSRQHWLTPLVAAPIVFAFAFLSVADEVTIDESRDTSLTIDGDDIVKITESGAISTVTDRAYGIESNGAQNTITNFGMILTLGEDGHGIRNTAGTTTIVNGGLIRAIGRGSHGIDNAASFATLTNTGMIESDGVGIRNAGNDTRITNTGVINAGAHGIRSTGNRAAVTNFGLIRATGTDRDGVHFTSASRRSTFTNSGAVISDQRRAIRASGSVTDLTVNLNAPGFLGGGILFNATTTLNITTGASHSVLWQLPDASVLDGGAPNFSGSVPWFYDAATGEFATFDPTGLTASFNQLADTANTLARVGRYGLGRARAGNGAGGTPDALLAYGDSDEAAESFDALLATNSGPETAYGPASGRFWITGFGGYANHGGDDATLDQRIDQIGAAFGYSWQQTPDARLSVVAGYMYGTITAESPWADAQDIDSNGVFAGVYGDKRFGPVTLGFGVSGGWQTNDSTRFVNDNLATSGGLFTGESHASASYDSWFVTPEATLSADIDLGQTGLVLTPTVRGRYALQRTNGYTESGSNANATVDAHTLGVAEGDFELALSRNFQLVTLTGRAGYLLRTAAGNDDVPVTLLGITNSVGLGATDRSAAYLGAALDLDLGPQASFTLDGQGYLSDDIDALEGMARFAIRF